MIRNKILLYICNVQTGVRSTSSYLIATSFADLVLDLYSRPELFILLLLAPNVKVYLSKGLFEIRVIVLLTCFRTKSITPVRLFQWSLSNDKICILLCFLDPNSECVSSVSTICLITSHSFDSIFLHHHRFADLLLHRLLRLAVARSKDVLHYVNMLASRMIKNVVIFAVLSLFAQKHAVNFHRIPCTV